MSNETIKISNRATLPILQRLIGVYKFWHDIMPGIAKISRYTLGEKIDGLFLEIMEFMYVASFLPKEEKPPYLQKAVGKLDLLKFFLHLSWETKVFDNKKYILLSEPLEEVGRMLGGCGSARRRHHPPQATWVENKGGLRGRTPARTQPSLNPSSG